MGRPLPPGWQSAIDPKHNREYYFDQGGNVQWTVPSAGLQPPLAAAAAPAAAPAAAAAESSTLAATATPAADVAAPSPAAAAPAASGEESLFKKPKRNNNMQFTGLFAALPEELVERVAIAACCDSVVAVAYLCRLERAWAELLSSNAVWEAPTVARFPVLRRLLQAASPPPGFRFRHFYFCSLCLLRDTIEAWDDSRQHSDYGWLGSLRVVDEEGHLRLRPSQPPPGRRLQDLLFSIEVTYDGSVCGSWQGFLSATPGQSEQALRPAHDGACDINSSTWAGDSHSSPTDDAPSPVAWELPVFDGYPWPSFFPEDELEEVDFTKARLSPPALPRPASRHTLALLTMVYYDGCTCRVIRIRCVLTAARLTMATRCPRQVRLRVVVSSLATFRSYVLMNNLLMTHQLDFNPPSLACVDWGYVADSTLYTPGKAHKLGLG